MSEARVNNLSNESNTGGPTITGITTFSGANYFVPPVGTIAERPDNPEKGSLRFNTDSAKLEYYRGDGIGWTEIEASYENDSLPESGGYTGFIAGGNDPSPWTGLNVIQYYHIATLGSGADFGDLETGKTGSGTVCNKIRAVWPGGYTGAGYHIHISYNNIQSKGDGIDYGDLIGVKNCPPTINNQTRGIIGQAANQNSSPYVSNVLEYITIATTGDTKDFGDGQIKSSCFGCCSTTRGLWGAPGNTPAKVIYTTMSTLGDTTDFGTTTHRPYAGLSNAVRAVWSGDYFGNAMSYMTIATLGNGIDFGDLDVSRDSARGMSSPTRGLVAGGRSVPSQATINTISSFQIATTGNAIDFGDIVHMTNAADHSYNFFAGSTGHGGL